MPYIEKEKRDRLDPLIYLLTRTLKADYPAGRDLAGPLNYVITRLLIDTLPDAQFYSRYALYMGIIETIKLEMYRRLIAPYEGKKAEENGDVYAP